VTQKISVDEVTLLRRREAIAVAQSVLPIIIQAEMGKAAHEELTQDEYLGIKGANLPSAHDMAAYALEIGTEFIEQSHELLERPAPGLTGTA